MALPEGFSNPEVYFGECIKFFNEYKYLYNFPNTDLLVLDVLDKIKINNLEDLELNENFDLKIVKDPFLEEVLRKIEKLKPTFNDFHEDQNINTTVDVPLGPKKRHEITYLAKEIKNLCEETYCGVVVDFGSGLGYLDQEIYEITRASVLGLECNETNYVGAKKRQRKYYENSLQNVKYIKHRITEDSDTNIKQFLDDKFPNNKYFCMTGLHACADLTIDAINIFLRMGEAKVLILMPCCYHKMEQNLERFKNFPLSDCLKHVYENYKGFEFLNVPFLRLAAQQPNWADKMEDLIFNLLARAVLQLYAFRHNCKLKRNKRKAVNLKTLENNFESYIQNATSHGFRLIRNEPYNESDKDDNLNFDVLEILATWRQIPDEIFKKVGIFILLQNSMQRVFENFILYDRLVYLKENGIEKCSYKRVFDENKSPRCLALIAYK